MRYLAPLKWTKRVKGRDGVIRWYFNTGKTRPTGAMIYARLPDPGTAQFAATYAAMVGARTKRETVSDMLTIKGLAELYYKSDAFKKKAASSRDHYTRHIGIIVDMFDPTPATEMDRVELQRWLDEIATSGTCAAIRGSGWALYAWAAKRGYVTHNPFKHLEVPAATPYEPWPADLLERALAEGSNVRLEVGLLYYTAQRVSDVLTMAWSHVDGETIHVRQQKTGKELRIPIHPALRDILASAPRKAVTILGRPATRQGGQSLLAKLKRWADPTKVVTHGLRKNAVIALLEAGCSIAETSSISGQSLAMVEHYAKQRNQTKLASAAILKWSNKA